LPGYVGHCNSTTLVGSPPFGYACTDDRAGDACAFWHPPGVPPREMEYHETSYVDIAARKRRTPLPIPKSPHHGSKFIDTARDLFPSHKRSSHFAEHFSGIPDVGRLTIEEPLPDSSADTDAITLMMAGSDLPAGGSVTCILGHTKLMCSIGKSPDTTSKALQPIPELIGDAGDDSDNGPCLHAAGSPATPITEHPHLRTSMRCPYCCGVLKCLFADCNIDGKHQIHMQYAECTCKESRM
jgi:hypothetical protein